MKKRWICSLLILFSLCFATVASAQAIDEKVLNAKQQSIVTIAALTAQGDLAKLKPALAIALNNGLTINQIKEVLIQMYAYTGFPRSLNGLNTFITVLDERKAQGIIDVVGADATFVEPERNRYAIGEKTQTELVGRPVTGRVYDFAPTIAIFLKEHLFGDIFERDILTYQERELATVGALAGIGNVNAQLASHMRVSMNIGITKEQLQAMIIVLHDTVSKKTAENAKQVLENIQ